MSINCYYNDAELQIYKRTLQKRMGGGDRPTHPLYWADIISMQNQHYDNNGLIEI